MIVEIVIVTGMDGWMSVKLVVSMVTRRSDYHGYQTVVSCLFVITVDVYMLNLYIYVSVCLCPARYTYTCCECLYF